MKNKIISTMLAASICVLAAACGSASENTTTDVAVSDKTVEAAEAANVEDANTSELADSSFPMTIQHGLGEITLEEKPENVVAIAWGNPDVPLALGVIPVGISEANFGPRDENGLLAWTAKAFKDAGVTPNVFDDTDGWDYEAISDCAPDVILAAYSGLSQE
ncbi:MAG: iron-siderophore ABC transporter substrate-binding protein, partial [Oscillospiraceae bacterium]|nr:iron-siderophore ABC transporter substrate-binding protein [Oscillospiraceae bacterium]